MQPRSYSQLLAYFGLLQVFLILTALLIEDGVGLLKTTFELTDMQELFMLFGIWLSMALVLVLGYKTMLKLLTLARIMDEFFTEEEGKRFTHLLKRLGKKRLTSSERIELQKYVEKSPISNDFIDVYESKKNTLWDKIKLIIGTFFSISLLVMMVNKWEEKQEKKSSDNRIKDNESPPNTPNNEFDTD